MKTTLLLVLKMGRCAGVFFLLCACVCVCVCVCFVTLCSHNYVFSSIAVWAVVKKKPLVRRLHDTAREEEGGEGKISSDVESVGCGWVTTVAALSNSDLVASGNWGWGYCCSVVHCTCMPMHSCTGWGYCCSVVHCTCMPMHSCTCIHYEYRYTICGFHTGFFAGGGGEK